MALEDTTHPGGATYVKASVLHMAAAGSPRDMTEIARAVAAKAIPSPFNPHLATVDGPAPRCWSADGGFFLYSRLGHLHSHHRSDEDLANWMARHGGWRVAYVDGIRSIVREDGDRIAVLASGHDLHGAKGRIQDPLDFCRGKIRFCDDEEEAVSADEPLTAQIMSAASRCPGGDLARHAAHILAIAAAAERAGGEVADAPGAFADRVAAVGAIVDFSGAIAAGRQSAGAARSNAIRIRSRLEGGGRAAS